MHQTNNVVLPSSSSSAQGKQAAGLAGNSLPLSPVSFDRVFFFLIDLSAVTQAPFCLPSSCKYLGEGLHSLLDNVSREPCI